jgi:hypothetical protein
MMGTSHRVVAAGAWLVTATEVGLPTWQVAAGVVPAVAFSAGPTSCDVDNTKTWKRLDRWLPDEWLGEGGPLQHRGFLHWWGLPVAVALVLYLTDGPWYAWAAVLGWGSHLAADGLCGKAGFGTGRGIPFGPWWWHVGAGFRCGGLVEKTLVPVGALAVAWWLAGGHLPAGVAGLPVVADVAAWRP